MIEFWKGVQNRGNKDKGEIRGGIDKGNFGGYQSQFADKEDFPQSRCQRILTEKPIALAEKQKHRSPILS